MNQYTGGLSNRLLLDKYLSGGVAAIERHYSARNVGKRTPCRPAADVRYLGERSLARAPFRVVKASRAQLEGDESRQFTLWFIPDSDPAELLVSPPQLNK